MPRIRLAVAHAPVISTITRSASSTSCTPTPRPSAGGSARKSCTARRVSSDCTPAICSKAETSTNSDPPMISQAAKVTWRGRDGLLSLMGSFN